MIDNVFVDLFVTSECIHFYILCCISLYPDVPIERIINVINSCKIIEVNPTLLIEGKIPHSWGALGFLDSASEVGTGK